MSEEFKLPPKKIVAATVMGRPKSLNTIMDDAVSILAEQVERLRLKSRSYTLEEKDVKNLKIYVSSLVEISKEERERDKSDEFAKKLAKLTDQELLDLAQSKLKAVEPAKS